MPAKSASEMSPAQRTAIVRAIDVGMEIQSDFPEVEALYVAGNGHARIITKLDLERHYGINNLTAKTALHYALCGNRGGFGRNSYDGLLSEGQRDDLAREHRVRAGKRLYEEGRGIHSLDRQILVEIGSRVGTMTRDKGLGIFAADEQTRRNRASIAGTASRDKGVGIHAQTLEEKAAAGRRGVRARGRIPLVSADEAPNGMDELDYTISLVLGGEYIYEEGNHRGKTNWGLVIGKVNEVYHGDKKVRRVNSLRSQVYKSPKFRKE